ncbi:MAG: S41 family peptidase [Sedimentisphaerales bacterium]
MKRTYLIGLSFFAALLFTCYGFTAQSNDTAASQSGSVTVGDGSAALRSSSLRSTSAVLIEQICSAIYEGDFAGARGLVGQGEKSEVRAITQLSDIISVYEATEQKRRTAQKAAYEEQLSELAKRQKSFGSRRSGAEQAATNIDDVNDVNDIVDTLSVIVKACEFADEAQKEQLLSDSFVKEVLQRAIDKAAEFEVAGKWLEAYTNCYYWLMAIDPKNEGYSDYAEMLLDKAAIAASFEDNPCETREERFRGVKKEMFIRTIIYLDLHYVSVVDYNQMARQAIKRCELLGEVAGTSSRFSQDSRSEDTGLKKTELKVLDERISELSELLSEQPPTVAIGGFLPPDRTELAAWSASLGALLNEVKSPSGGPTEFDKRKFLEVFEKVLMLNETTVDLPRQVVIAQFAEAALDALDPYTVIVWPRQVQDFEKMMTNEFTGIGIEISKQKGLLTVASLLPDTPAYKSGLDADDVIEAVEGVKTKDMSLSCAVHKITGPKGTKVTLTIRRPGEEKTKEITITRDRIVVPTIRGWQRADGGKWLYMIDEGNKIGYVLLTGFSAETASSLEKVLVELESEGLRGLILDLRSNSGGLLDSAVAVVDKFIEEGLIVKRQPGLGGKPTPEMASKKNTHPNYPLVILINSGSASASEIVAGALADKVYKRAILVGTRTHGKGSVQGITSYPAGGSQLKYTMAHYHLPSDQRVESQEEMKKQGREDWGVGPNVEVELRSDELRKMIEVQRDNEVLVQADHEYVNDKPRKHTVEETLAADPQLEVALLIVRSKLIQAGAPALAQQD